MSKNCFDYYFKCLYFKKKTRNSEISLSVKNKSFTEDSVKVFNNSSVTESTFITQMYNQNYDANSENTFNPLTVNTISVDQIVMHT